MAKSVVVTTTLHQHLRKVNVLDAVVAGTSLPNWTSVADDGHNTFETVCTTPGSTIAGAATVVVPNYVPPDVTAPTITSTNTASVAENATLSKSLTANETVTWSITGGADAARFEISGSTLRWASNGTKDFEAPDDANADNVYVVQVTATDAALNATNQTISVTVTNVAEGPVWADTYVAPAFNDSSAAWNGYNVRVRFEAAQLSVSGGSVRLTLSAGTGEGTAIDSMYIGHAAAAGDVYDFDGTQVQALVSGSGSFTVPVSSSVVTDTITYAFDESKPFIVAFHMNSAANDTLRGATVATGVGVYYKSAAAEASVANVTGYTTLSTSSVRLVSKIEAG